VAVAAQRKANSGRVGAVLDGEGEGDRGIARANVGG
jgi:hypothetical protein